MGFALFRHRLLDLAPVARDVIIEGMQDGIIVLDPGDRIVETNQSRSAYPEYPRGSTLIGKKLADAIDQWPKLVKGSENATKTEDEIALGTGADQRWVGLSSFPPSGRRNETVGRLIIIRDITARKKAEEQLRQLSRAVESSPTSIIITDTDGNIQYANPKFTQVTGYTLEEAFGKNPNILKTDQTPYGTHQRCGRRFLQGASGAVNFATAKKMAKPSGSWHLFLRFKMTMETSGFMLQSKKILQNGNIPRKPRIAYDQAMEASRAKSQLLANVSHELRTPLGGILGYAELLKNGTFGELAEGQRRCD